MEDTEGRVWGAEDQDERGGRQPIIGVGNPGKGIHWLGGPLEAVQWPAPGCCFDCIGGATSRGL